MNAILAKLQEAGLKPTSKKINDFHRISVSVGKRDVEIDVTEDGKVIRSSKYAYLLPESVGDEVRLA